MTTTLDLSTATGLQVANTDAFEVRIANQTIWTAPAPPAWSPADIPSLFGWYKADDLTGANLDIKSTWPDRSGGGRHLTVPSGLNGAYLQNNALNGHKTLLGLSVYSMGYRWQGAGLSGYYAAYIVTRVRNDLGGAGARILGSIYPDNSNFLIGHHGGFEGTFYAGNFLGDATKTAPTGTFGRFGMTGPGTTRAYKNGVQVESRGDANANFGGGISINGYALASTNEMCDWESPELIVCNDYLDHTTMLQLDAYLATEYAL